MFEGGALRLIIDFSRFASRRNLKKIIIKIKGVSLSGYYLADDNKTFSCVVIKDKNTFAGTLYKNKDKPLKEYGVLVST